MKKTFTDDTEAGARRKADEWWKAQTGLREIDRTVLGTGDDGPARADMDRWAVTIHYEPENSN
jgi:hypothetical protein